MPPSKDNSGFDYEAYKSRLSRVVIPEKLKCKRCAKIRPPTSFSKRQLDQLKSSVALSQSRGRSDILSLSRPGIATCHNCTGNQTFELTCCICDRTKGLSSFSKAQRKMGDQARCYTCLQGHLDADPIDDERDAFDDASTTLGLSQAPYDLTTHTTTTLRNLALSDTVPSHPDEDSEDDAGGVWIEPARSSNVNGSAAGTTSGNGRKGSGWSSIASGSGIVPAPASVAGTERSGVSCMTDRTEKFARVRDQGPRFTKTNLPRFTGPAFEGETLDEDDEGDGESDDEDEDGESDSDGCGINSKYV